MPTYTFDCPKCGRFDVSLRMSAPSLEGCPNCNSEVKRVFIPQSAIFKGGLPSNNYQRNYSFLDKDKLSSGKVTAEDAMKEYKAKRWGENASPEQILGDFQRTLDNDDKRLKNTQV